VVVVLIVLVVLFVLVELTMLGAPCHVRFWKSPTSSHTAEGVCYASRFISVGLPCPGAIVSCR
jgi:hypothetical protein